MTAGPARAAPARLLGLGRAALAATGAPTVLGILLLVHFGFAALRFPAGALHKRQQSIADWQRRGAAGWCFRLADAETQRVAQWLAATVQPDDLVCYDGEPRGALQLLAPLLFPALLLQQHAATGPASRRPVFAARAPWLAAGPPAGRTPVVVATVDSLRLEYR